MQQVVLGRTGLTVSRLAIGTGTSGWAKTSEQTRALGLQGLADLLVYAHERGITFFDTADEYGSHPHVREALTRIPRDRVVLTTKTVARTAAAARADLDRFKRELGTDYLDIVLLHCMMDARWNERLRPVMDVLSEAKRRGEIRAVGTSNHDAGALRTTVAEPWVEVVLVRINEAGIQMEASPAEVREAIVAMQAAGKGTYGMKVMGGGGRLTSDPRRAIAYQLGLPVDAFVIGMSSRAQVDENLGYLEELSAVPAQG